MEIIKITEERINQILPQTVKDSTLSNEAKKLLATIMNYYVIHSKVRAEQCLIINNNELREASGIGMDYMLSAKRELVEAQLITIVPGRKRTKGQKGLASQYRLVRENLTKPVRILTAEELLEMAFSTPLKPPCTGNSIVYANIDTNIKTKTETNTQTYTHTDTYLRTDIHTEPDTEVEKNSQSHTDTQEDEEPVFRKMNGEPICEIASVFGDGLPF